jgi:hypothetical protein
MDIKASSNHVVITGNIKSVLDFQNIKNTIDAVVAQNKVLYINIADSLSITSSVIGYFNKLILKDGIELNLNVGNDQLLDLLDDLNLIITFRARKV